MTSAYQTITVIEALSIAWSMPLITLSDQHIGLSDNGLRKNFTAAGIELPSSDFWPRKSAGRFPPIYPWCPPPGRQKTIEVRLPYFDMEALKRTRGYQEAHAAISAPAPSHKKISRSTLYLLVWSMPISTLGDILQHATTRIRTECKVHDIPRPPSRSGFGLALPSDLWREPLSTAEDIDVLDVPVGLAIDEMTAKAVPLRPEGLGVVLAPEVRDFLQTWLANCNLGQTRFDMEVVSQGLSYLGLTYANPAEIGLQIKTVGSLSSLKRRILDCNKHEYSARRIAASLLSLAEWSVHGSIVPSAELPMAAETLTSPKLLHDAVTLVASTDEAVASAPINQNQTPAVGSADCDHGEIESLLLGMAARVDTDWRHARDRCLFELLFKNRVGLMEALRIKDSDIDFLRGRVTLTNRSGTLRELQIHEGVLLSMVRYGSLRPTPADGHFFIGKSNSVLARQSVHRLLTSHLGQLGLPVSLTPRLLRKATAR